MAKYQEFVECPWCKTAVEDDGEFDDACYTNTECEKCGELFVVSSHHKVTYTTTKPKCIDSCKLKYYSDVDLFGENGIALLYRCTVCDNDEYVLKSEVNK